jgi:Uma2 family endonuclease
MTSLETLVEPLRHSPQLVEAVALLSRQIEEERARRNRFYEEMTPEEKIEFIDGEVVLHSPARNRHLDATARLSRLIGTWVSLKGLGTLKIEKCLCVFPRNDYEPDLVFFGKEKATTLVPDTMKFPIPDFIVEVLSESTEARDRGVKFEDYAAHGVGEYWIVDADRETVEQYLLGESGYELRVKSATGTLTSEVIEGLVVPVRALFDEAENLAIIRGWMGATPP